jgi:hypothetical protein
MAKQTINIGTSANKGDGDPLRTAFSKINLNFSELYESIGGGTVTTYVAPNETETVFSAVNSDIITGKFILQIIASDQTVQSCEVVAIKKLDDTDAYASVFGLVYTSVGPIATVDAIVDADSKLAITVTSLGLGLSVSSQSIQQITRWED